MTAGLQLDPSPIGAAQIELRHARRIVLGAAGIGQPGWSLTDKDTLNVVDRTRFLQLWRPGSIDCFMAEHVWEHLWPEEAIRADANCFEFLRPGGHLRIAVPDGLHPDPLYIEWVRPGGNGPLAEDHKVLYEYRLLKSELESQGFVVNLLEYWDEDRHFHFSDWTSEDGHIRRSSRYDSRNREHPLAYTSLIVDGIKPSDSTSRS